MLHFEKEIATPAHLSCRRLPVTWCALPHPVEPDAGDITATVYVIMADRHINRAMKFDSCHFGPAEERRQMNVVNTLPVTELNEQPKLPTTPV